MKTTAVLPAFNAERTLSKTYDAIPKDIVDEVILVDDASTDNTVDLANQISEVIVVLHDKNRGYGGNQKTCYDEALRRGADVVVMIHPDFQYDPGYVPDIVKPIQDKQAEFVMGSRFLGHDPRAQGMIWWRYWGNRLLTSAQNATLNLNLSECHSGYRAYSRDLLEQISYHDFSDAFVFDSQMLAAISNQSFTIVEVPIPTKYTLESSSASFLASVRYGIQTLYTLLGK